MNVVSLFDGISCGQVALKNIGITPDYYFASEIDKNCIRVTQHHHPHTIQLGNVKYIDFRGVETVDLLLAGSPCQGFSFEGKMQGFEDSRSGLFFELVRILRELKPKYVLVENVRMSADNKKRATDLLELPCYSIDSAAVSAQTRNRLYWTNIPFNPVLPDRGLLFKDIRQVSDDDVYWKDFQVTKLKEQEYIRGDYYRFEELDKKVQCLTASPGLNKPKEMLEDGRVRTLSPLEWERCQTLPDNYTNVPGVLRSARYHMLGNGWTVAVIQHILEGMKPCLEKSIPVIPDISADSTMNVPSGPLPESACESSPMII